MGKSRTRRLKTRNFNPTGVLSVKDIKAFEELNCTNLETGTVESILEKLQSRSSDDKECAAVTIANMATNSSFISSMIENKLIRIAGPLLLDKNLAVRHAVAGCLRNIAASGDHSVCQAMVDQDILTSLVELFMEYKAPWTPVKSTDIKIDSKYEIFLECCNLLWCLCESSDTAVAIFNEKKLVKILLPCLNIEVYGLQIPVAIAQCLHTVGEENPDVIEELSQPLILEQLKKLMSLKPIEPEHALLRILAAGITLNTVSDKIRNCMSDITLPIIEVITSTLDEPITPALSVLSEQITVYKCEKTNKYHDEKDLEEKLNAVHKAVKIVDYMLQAKQISLEMLANLCFGDDSNEEWDDISSSDTSEEMEMDVDDIPVMPLKLGLQVPLEIHEIIVHKNLMQKVIDQIVMPSEEVLKVITDSQESANCLRRLNTVRCRALLCLNNMVQGLEIDDMGGSSKLFELWMNIANLIFKQTDISDNEQLDAATCSLRAILQKLAEASCCSHFSSLTECDLQLLIDICQQTQESTIKVNIIRALGTIGCLLGNPQLFQTSHKLITMIGLFLLDTCSKSSDLWVIAETLDVMFDVFGEDHVDIIAQEIKLVEKLKNILPLLKGKIKQQRKSFGEHFPVIMTAKTNLIRFIKYKCDLNKK